MSSLPIGTPKESIQGPAPTVSPVLGTAVPQKPPSAGGAGGGRGRGGAGGGAQGDSASKRAGDRALHAARWVAALQKTYFKHSLTAVHMWWQVQALVLLTSMS